MEKPSVALKKITSYRVIYGDTDQMGIVYYANYLRWFEKVAPSSYDKSACPIRPSSSRDFIFP